MRKKKSAAREICKKKVWVVATIFVKKSSKSELSSRFLSRLKILQDLESHHETCEVPISRSYAFLSVTMTFVSKSYPRCPKNQISMTFGGGVQESISIFFLTFGPKLTCTFLVCWYDEMMTWWSDVMMTWWYDDRNTRNILFGTQGMSCLEHTRCPAWNTGDVLLGTHEMFCFEHTRCLVSNTRNVLLRTQGMSCFQRTECPLLNLKCFKSY